jgi:hypothetical protein
VEESRLVYPTSDAGGEWNSFAGLDSNDPAAAAAAVPVLSRASGEQMFGQGSSEGALDGSLGADSVDMLLARNEERLRRLDAIST